MTLSSAAISSAQHTVSLDIEQLYSEHAQFIGRVLTRLVGHGQHVDDLLQETFVAAFRQRDTFSGQATARTWLYAIAARLSLRHKRDAGRFFRMRSRFAMEPKCPTAEKPDRNLDRKEASRLVHEALAKLPFKQREVFVLYELEELDGQRIAKMVGVPVGTVWTRLHHARKKFRRVLRKKVENEL